MRLKRNGGQRAAGVSAGTASRDHCSVTKRGIFKETAYIFRKGRSGRGGRTRQGGRGLHSAKSGEFSFPRHPHVADLQPYRYFNSGKVEDSMKNPCLKVSVSAKP